MIKHFFPSTLTRYIFFEVLIFFGICLGVFTGILFTMRLLKFASMIVNKGVEAQQVLMVFASIIPTFLEIAIPLASLLGIMLAFARLSGDSEIIVLRASGISIRSLLRPVLLFALCAGFFTLSVSLYAKPWGFATLSKTFFEIARARTTAGITSGLFNKLGNLTLYADKVLDDTGELSRVLIDDQRDPANRQIITAQRGKIFSDPVTRTISFSLFDGTSHQLINEKYISTSFRANKISLNADEIYNPEVSKKGVPAKELFPSEITESIIEYVALKKHLTASLSADEGNAPPLSNLLLKQLSGQEINVTLIEKKLMRLRIEEALRFSMPFAAFILALIGLPLGIQPPRLQKTWGAGLSIVVGMCVFVLYYALLSVGIVLAESKLAPIHLSVWIPNLMCSIAAVYSIYMIASERWQSVALGITDSFSFIKKKKS